MMKARIAFLWASFWVATSPGVFAAPPSNTLMSLDTIVTKYVKKDGFQGNVVIRQGDEIIFSRSYGDAVIEFNIPNAEDTKFRIGSLSKQFTATGIMLLQQDGKLDVLKPVARYLDVPSDWSEVTIHELLTHSAGLSRDSTLTKDDYSEYHSLDQLLLSIMKMPFQYTPGQGAAYSNAGYAVLAKLIEKVSGQNYGSFLKARVFDPGGLKDTGEDHDSLIVPQRAKGYVFIQHQLRSACCSDLSNLAGAGDIYSTTEDLLRWDSLLYTDRLLSQKSRDEMFTAYTTLKGGIHYGYAWVIDRWHGHPVIWHNGAVDGFLSDFWRDPETKTAIVILSNRMDSPLNSYLSDLRQELAKAVD